MKKYFIILLLLSSAADAQKTEIQFAVNNPIDIARPTESITITLEGLFQQHPSMRTKNFILTEDRNEIPFQFVDENLDGTNDYLLFQASLAPREQKIFSLKERKNSSARIPSLVDARFVLPREDFAWENDRVAFRMYGPALAAEVNNGIDAWTKRVRYPIVAKWYKESEGSLPGKDTYHHDRGEGADFFSVGRTLGAGSSGILFKGSLIQPGVFSHYKIIANGPIRMIAELYYDHWDIGGMKFLQIKRITLDVGEQLNKIEDRFVSASNIDSMVVAAGLVKRSGAGMQQNGDARWMTLWGPTNTDSINGYLGTAIVFPREHSVSFSEDTLQYFISSTIGVRSPFVYYSGFAWTRMGDIRSEREWIEYLHDFSRRKRNPLTINFLTIPKK